MKPIIFGIGSIGAWNFFPVAKIWAVGFELWFAWIAGTVSGDMSFYHQLVASGLPCMVQVSSQDLPFMGLGIVSQVQPACIYDPNNTNPYIGVNQN